MAWTAPMTAVANAVFTAAQFNAHVRDNLLETAPAKATTAGGYFVATGTNAIAERQISKATVAATCTRTANSYAITIRNSGTGTGNRFGGAFLVTGLTAGSNTFTAKYRNSADTSTFENRDIIVMPL